MTDFVSDLVIRIKNGQKARLPAVSMPSFFPKKYLPILHILYIEGYIRGHKECWDPLLKQNIIIVDLKYRTKGEAVIENIFRISTPGRPIFSAAKTLWSLKNGKGIFILSTTKGFLVDRTARFLNLGGEVLFGIY